MSMRDRGSVAEISSVAFSTEREQAPQWGVATIEVAGQGFDIPQAEAWRAKEPDERQRRQATIANLTEQAKRSETGFDSPGSQFSEQKSLVDKMENINKIIINFTIS